MSKHTVEKIGGTSMSRFGEIVDNVILGNRKEDEIYNRVFVVSAYGGITNALLEHKKTGESGVYQYFKDGDQKWEVALDKVTAQMKEVNTEMVAAEGTTELDAAEGHQLGQQTTNQGATDGESDGQYEQDSAGQAERETSKRKNGPNVMKAPSGTVGPAWVCQGSLSTKFES